MRLLGRVHSQPPEPSFDGPTLNPEYNKMYNTWAAIGYDGLPYCDGCDCVLTNKEVKLTLNGWLCDSCYTNDK